ncbi:VanZ family protein [Streptococcus loxodontisalivarius]|uniref:Glycopeptide antibiotics resistance protein n=1 Tax=Streptococcus loxodontisalivarius TaxID=1349415 RepID=A0ABS2PUL9_9STRE|nr:VanZ family protein [Streptococcus loxodontisalivarius]MBM7643756.1 glycopeptide antibiotics resistance protein [Streptococcus loxodontisalivarius]
MYKHDPKIKNSWRLASAVISFILSTLFYSYFLIPYSHYISNYGMFFAFLLNLAIILMMTYFGYVCIRFMVTGRLYRSAIIILYILYALSLVYLLFLKDIGTQGISFNPFSFVNDILSGSRFVPIMNLIMFLPLGFLFPMKKWSTASFLIFILAVEWCQYHFSLGIFDLGDVTANTISFILGSFLGSIGLRSFIKNRIH